jgi:galactose mutarotase-like enzyme
MSFRQVSVSGFPAVALRSAELEVVAIPSLGAKLSNLRRHRGREWLWRNEQIPLAPPDPAASYVETADSGGWDECFPTVGPCDLPGPNPVHLPDHGELWSTRWECAVYESQAGTVFTARANGTFLPCEFLRELTLDSTDPVIRFRYRLRHLGDRPFPWLWSAHPLFNVQPGTTLEVPGLRQVKVDSARGRSEAPNAVIPWPLDGGESFRFPEPGGWAMKVFGDAAEAGRAILTDQRAGERLELVVPPGQVPQLGMWINCGGWAPAGKTPYYNLGLEPCIGAPDRLDRAVEEWHSAATLELGETREWGFEVWLPG